MIIRAFISSWLDYCDSLYSPASANHLLAAYKWSKYAAARLLTGSIKITHITPILYSLHWLPIKFRIRFKVLVITYRAPVNAFKKKRSSKLNYSNWPTFLQFLFVFHSLILSLYAFLVKRFVTCSERLLLYQIYLLTYLLNAGDGHIKAPNLT